MDTTTKKVRSAVAWLVYHFIGWPLGTLTCLLAAVTVLLGGVTWYVNKRCWSVVNECDSTAEGTPYPTAPLAPLSRSDAKTVASSRSL